MNSEELHQIEVRFKRYVAYQTVAEELMFDIEASVHEHLWGDLVFRLKADLLSDHLPPETIEQRTFVRYQVPASTWQAWKKRHGQTWYARRLVERWPVRYEVDPDGRGEYAVCTFNLERYMIYPQSRLKASEHGRAVRMSAFSSDWIVGGDA